MIILGIDPDKGYAVAKNQKIIEAGTVKGMKELKKKVDLIAKRCRDARAGLMIRIERPTNPKVFPRPGLSHAAMIKIARNVGMNYEKCEELGRFCQSLSLKYEFVCPSRKKLTSKEIKNITGWDGRTSQHCRDSIMLAFR